ncbi:MAG TPA: hypothetical protein VIY56_12280, partial [Vicinamibacterales bacterium]
MRSTNILASVAGLVAVGWLLGASVWAQPTDPLRLYNEALARESSLRAEFTTPRDVDPVGVRRRVRTLVGAYRDLARLFPSSGVGDKALWQGGMLSADAFDKWGDAQDRSAALRAFEALSKAYPSSTLVRQVPSQTRRLSETAVRTVSTVPPPAPPVVAPPVVAPAAVAPALAASLVGAGPVAANASAPKPAAPPPAALPEPPPAPAPPAALLTAIRHELVQDALRITLEVDRETVFSSER